MMHIVIRGVIRLGILPLNLGLAPAWIGGFVLFWCIRFVLLHISSGLTIALLVSRGKRPRGQTRRGVKQAS